MPLLLKLFCVFKCFLDDDICFLLLERVVFELVVSITNLSNVSLWALD